MGNSNPLDPASKAAETVRILRNQLDKEPENQAIRMRLIKAYDAAGQVPEFERESELYKQIEADGLGRLKVQRSGTEEVSKQSGSGKAAFRRFADDAATKSALAPVAQAYRELRVDPKYLVQLDLELARVGGRPTPLVHANALSRRFGGAQIYFKNEYLAGSDAHLTIAAIGQAHLARCLGRKRMVAGVRDVKWGLHMAGACARFGLQSEIYIEKDTYEQHATQIFQMRLMGAQVTSVDTRDFRAGDVREAGLDSWLRRSRESLLFMGLDNGPSPYPDMARDHTAVIGRECRRQMTALTNRSPDVVVVRGGENTDALGLFPAFLDDRRVRLISVEPQPEGRRPRADRFDAFQQLHSRGEEKRMQAVLEGLEYVSVSRENAQLLASGRIERFTTSANNALAVLRDMSRLEGTVPGLKTAHALAWIRDVAASMSTEQTIVLLLKERGDKDLWDIMRLDQRG